MKVFVGKVVAVYDCPVLPEAKSVECELIDKSKKFCLVRFSPPSLGDFVATDAVFDELMIFSPKAPMLFPSLRELNAL